MNAIELNHVSKAYGDFVLNNISFTLPMGTIMGLVGENGAGKSTTIKLIMDAVRADAGEISVLGVSNQDKKFRDVKQDIGIVLDEACFPQVLTPGDLNAVFKATYRNWDRQAYEGYLDTFSLPRDKQISQFSRGMKMKLAIGAALSHHPRLLILDEATSGLDPMVRDEILAVFNEFTREEDHAILLSSHIISDLEKICDYVTFLHRGQMVLSEEKDRLLEKYALVKLSCEDFEALPEGAAVRRRKVPYGYEALVLREWISDAIPREITGLEDIILFLAKEDD